MTTPTEIWKQVPLDFTFGETILASNLGNIKHNDIPVRKYKSSSGKSGYYSICIINDHTLYFHRLVFYAHSTLPLNILKQGRVIFKNKENIVDNEGFYRNWYEDLLFERYKIDFLSLLDTVTVKDDIHPLYGPFTYGTWIPIKIPKDKTTNEYIEVSNYELVLLDNNRYPLLIRNTTTNKIIKYNFHNSHDGYTTITYSKTSANYQISHLMLLTVFPHIQRNETVDHIDNDALNHNIKNMQWLSRSENAIKGAKLSAINKDFKQTANLTGEEWRPLHINEYTSKLYKISNMGRIQNTFQITLGNRLRGKKYKYTNIAISKGIYKRYYIHQLVYITFHEPIPDGSIILHDDSAPLHNDGTYRNWAIDLRAGSKRENNIEYHSEKRNALYTCDISDTKESVENTVIMPSEDTIPSNDNTVSVSYWTAHEVYSAYISGNIKLYKAWCESTQELSESTWDELWAKFIGKLDTSDDSTRLTIINKFINKLAKHRGYKQQKPNATLALQRGAWTWMSVLDAWRSGTLDVYKTHQENYTSDSPDCPKWQARWASFIDSLTKATNDTEYRTVIQRFMKNQQSRASRLRIANSNNSQTEEIQTESTLAPSSQSLSPPPSAINTVIEPTIHHTAPKQWKVKQIYEHFQANTLDEYKHWCETTHTLSGPEWDIQWYTFTLELQRAPDRPTADSIIRAFIEGLRKKRHDILSQKNNYKANPLERDTRQQWPSVSVLRAWKENKLDLFKEFQENYTSDSPDCPKWQQRWNGFVDSLRDASSDDERKTCISKFMTAQRTRVYRAKKYIRT